MAASLTATNTSLSTTIHTEKTPANPTLADGSGIDSVSSTSPSPLRSPRKRSTVYMGEGPVSTVEDPRLRDADYLSSQSVKSLKNIAKALEIPITGLKAELVERIRKGAEDHHQRQAASGVSGQLSVSCYHYIILM